MMMIKGAIIYYFSGTGNSLYIARELKQRMPDSYLQPVLSTNKTDIAAPQSERIGLVFPIYLSSIPGPIRTFIDNINMQPDQYIFAITTNCGYPGRVDYLLSKALKERGLKLHFYASLKMLSNNPTGLMPTYLANKKWAEQSNEKSALEILPGLQKQLYRFAGDLTGKVNNIAPDIRPSLPRRALLSVTERISPSNSTKTIAFSVDHDCSSCGTCEKVCPADKVILSDGKPQWLNETQCYFCYACFNFCPRQAILVKGYNKKTGRYSHPGISAEDIAGQKPV
jgi:ferredoxin